MNRNLTVGNVLIIRSANTALSELKTVDDNDDNNDDTLASRTTSQLLLRFRKMNPSKNAASQETCRQRRACENSFPADDSNIFSGWQFTGTAATTRLYLHWDWFPLIVGLWFSRGSTVVVVVMRGGLLGIYKIVKFAQRVAAPQTKENRFPN